jgi:serine/threonine protein kinase
MSPHESQVGRYRILAELGRGGMGRVLLGTGPDGRLVAVKLVHARLVDLPGFRERFRHEVAATSAVSGAYTAAVIDADAPTPWLASVYVPAPSLRDVAPLPEEAVLRLGAGLVSALVEIHHAGLVHADLKPSDVLLSADGPKVIDFGVARAAEEGAGEVSGKQPHDGRWSARPVSCLRSRPRGGCPRLPATCSRSAPCSPWHAPDEDRSTDQGRRRPSTTSSTPNLTSPRSPMPSARSSRRAWPKNR